MTFGEKLRYCRKKRRMTQTQLAAQAGLGLNTINNYEKGKTYPQDREVYETLARIFGVTSASLKNEDDELQYIVMDAATGEEEFITYKLRYDINGNITESRADAPVTEKESFYGKRIPIGIIANGGESGIRGEMIRNRIIAQIDALLATPLRFGPVNEFKESLAAVSATPMFAGGDGVSDTDKEAVSQVLEEFYKELYGATEVHNGFVVEQEKPKKRTSIVTKTSELLFILISAIKENSGRNIQNISSQAFDKILGLSELFLRLNISGIIIKSKNSNDYLFSIHNQDSGEIIAKPTSAEKTAVQNVLNAIAFSRNDEEIISAINDFYRRDEIAFLVRRMKYIEATEEIRQKQEEEFTPVEFRIKDKKYLADFGKIMILRRIRGYISKLRAVTLSFDKYKIEGLIVKIIEITNKSEIIANSKDDKIIKDSVPVQYKTDTEWLAAIADGLNYILSSHSGSEINIMAEHMLKNILVPTSKKLQREFDNQRKLSQAIQSEDLNRKKTLPVDASIIDLGSGTTNFACTEEFTQGNSELFEALTYSSFEAKVENSTDKNELAPLIMEYITAFMELKDNWRYQVDDEEFDDAIENEIFIYKKIKRIINKLWTDDEDLTDEEFKEIVMMLMRILFNCKISTKKEDDKFIIVARIDVKGVLDAINECMAFAGVNV